MLIDRKDIEDATEVVVSLCLRTEALAIRCLGHLLEQGVAATMSHKNNLLLVDARVIGREMERVNFALYLVEQWSLQDA